MRTCFADRGVGDKLTESGGSLILKTIPVRWIIKGVVLLSVLMTIPVYLRMSTLTTCHPEIDRPSAMFLILDKDVEAGEVVTPEMTYYLDVPLRFAPSGGMRVEDLPYCMHRVVRHSIKKGSILLYHDFENPCRKLDRFPEQNIELL
jgi:hypothetical protein